MPKDYPSLGELHMGWHAVHYFKSENSLNNEEEGKVDQELELLDGVAGFL